MKFFLYVGDAEGPKRFLEQFECGSLEEAKLTVETLYDRIAKNPVAPKGTILSAAVFELACIGTMTYRYAYLLDETGEILAMNPLCLRTGPWPTLR